MDDLAQLMARHCQPGRVTWLGVRPERRAPMQSVEALEAVAGRGLTGDRYRAKGGKRQVTLIQSEHLPVIAALLGLDALAPAALRRNLCIAGINLLALKDRRFQLGGALLEGTGLAHPCSRMEEVFGPGGYNAVRGHGGITARVIASGIIRLGDPLVPV
ncbi:MOSC domain-containing protein [Simiduia sp. 21SJ11W-1]|uniref:MOSC domain-containing protein n=1 Tax=Simiduia sp. 21SJ11W-1 TaxID=2909669 RepID=UPI00209D6AAC|nr:MOSC domain-containing protein [Simiduia sp. 21SJ11W-1]UTA47856.1 MOSC domain-containing protein [Simiduia sp. 21SJ11W-1]